MTTSSHVSAFGFKPKAKSHIQKVSSFAMSSHEECYSIKAHSGMVDPYPLQFEK